MISSPDDKKIKLLTPAVASFLRLGPIWDQLSHLASATTPSPLDIDHLLLSSALMEIKTVRLTSTTTTPQYGALIFALRRIIKYESALPQTTHSLFHTHHLPALQQTLSTHWTNPSIFASHEDESDSIKTALQKASRTLAPVPLPFANTHRDREFTISPSQIITLFTTEPDPRVRFLLARTHLFCPVGGAGSAESTARQNLLSGAGHLVKWIFDLLQLPPAEQTHSGILTDNHLTAVGILNMVDVVLFRLGDLPSDGALQIQLEGDRRVKYKGRSVGALAVLVEFMYAVWYRFSGLEGVREEELVVVCERLCGVEDRIVGGDGEVEMRYRRGVAHLVKNWVPEGEAGKGSKVVAGLRKGLAGVLYRGVDGGMGRGKVKGGDSPWREFQGRLVGLGFGYEGKVE